MADRYSPQRRSEIMARIGGKNTKPELTVRSLLHRMGYRFRLHKKDLPGKPDIVLPKYRVAVFVHGCFWHQHQGCRKCTIPKTREDWWRDKLMRNVERDRTNRERLEELGWRTIVLWECEIRNIEGLANKLVELLGRDKQSEC